MPANHLNRTILTSAKNQSTVSPPVKPAGLSKRPPIIIPHALWHRRKQCRRTSHLTGTIGSITLENRRRRRENTNSPENKASRGVAGDDDARATCLADAVAERAGVGWSDEEGEEDEKCGGEEGETHGVLKGCQSCTCGGANSVV